MDSKSAYRLSLAIALSLSFLACSVHPPGFEHAALRSGDRIGLVMAADYIVPDLHFGVTDSSAANRERTGIFESRYVAWDLGSLHLYLEKRNILYGIGIPGLNPALSIGYRFGNTATVVLHPTYSFLAREFAPGFQADFRVLPFFSASYMLYRDLLCDCDIGFMGGSPRRNFRSFDFHRISLYLEAGPLRSAFSGNEFLFIQPSVYYETSGKQMKYSVSVGGVWGKALGNHLR